MMNALATYTTEDGKRRIYIYQTPDGFFSFREEQLKTEIMSDIGQPDFDYWAEVAVGGYYDSADAAEQGARLGAPWMDSNSN